MDNLEDKLLAPAADAAARMKVAMDRILDNADTQAAGTMIWDVLEGFGLRRSIATLMDGPFMMLSFAVARIVASGGTCEFARRIAAEASERNIDEVVNGTDLPIRLEVEHDRLAAKNVSLQEARDNIHQAARVLRFVFMEIWRILVDLHVDPDKRVDTKDQKVQDLRQMAFEVILFEIDLYERAGLLQT